MDSPIFASLTTALSVRRRTDQTQANGRGIVGFAEGLTQPL